MPDNFVIIINSLRMFTWFLLRWLFNEKLLKAQENAFRVPEGNIFRYFVCVHNM